jgi:hypothetical protein
MEAIAILDEELDGSDSDHDVDLEEIDSMTYFFDAIRDFLQNKRLIPEEHPAPIEQPNARSRRRQAQRSSSLPLPDPAPRSPKVSRRVGSI